MPIDISKQPVELPLHISPSLCSGKTYIVTGANVGLGLEASRHLVANDASRVIMTARNAKAGEEAVADVERTTGRRGVAQLYDLDLSSYESVRNFATKVQNDVTGPIGGFIANAAVASNGSTTAEGHQLNLTVNIISTYYLAMLLLPKMNSSVDPAAAAEKDMPRLTFVASEACLEMGDFWEAIKKDPIVNMDNDKELGMKGYPASKMMEILATRHLAQHHLPLSDGSGQGHNKVIINCITPGLCKTSLSRNAPESFRKMLKEQHEGYGRTADHGSRTLLAGVAAGRESHGSFMRDALLDDEILPAWIKDATGCKLAWDSVAREIEKIDPDCLRKAFA